MTAGIQQCPVCSGPMWDETQSKFYKPGKPIAKCKNKACGGVLWAQNGGPTEPPKAAFAPHPTGNAAERALPHNAMVTEKLNELLGAYDICWSHALSLAKKAGPDVVLTLEGISAMTATLLIAAKEKGLA